MVNYQNGKIYKLVSNKTQKVYIGSTALTYLSTRLAGHRSNYNMYKNGTHHYVSSFDIIKIPGHRIILLDNWPCNSKDELNAREQYWIDRTPNTCNRHGSVNKSKIQHTYNRNKKHFVRCDYCDFECHHKNMDRHDQSANHERNVEYMNEIIDNS